MPEPGAGNVKGQIGYYKLTDWWLNAFSCTERKRIEQGWRTTSSEVSLTAGHIYHTTEAVSEFLFRMASQLLVSDDYDLAKRVVDKAMVCVGSRILDLHFFYQSQGGIYYAKRNCRSFALDAAVTAYQKQVAIAPEAAKAFRQEYGRLSALPIHTGFVQLAIIRANQKNYKEAIRLSKEAAEQGWRDTQDSWERRIERYERAAAKLNESPVGIVRSRQEITK